MIGDKDFRPKLDGILSDAKYLQRGLDTLAQHLGEDPGGVLRYCRERPGEFHISLFKDRVMIALKERMDRSIQQEADAIKKVMEGGSETDEELPEARLQPLPKEVKVEIPWDQIQTDINSCHMILSKTLRTLPGGRSRILLEQILLDLETFHQGVSKKLQVSTPKDPPDTTAETSE